MQISEPYNRPFLEKSNPGGEKEESETRLIYNDVTAIKVISFILVVLI